MNARPPSTLGLCSSRCSSPLEAASRGFVFELLTATSLFEILLTLSVSFFSLFY